MGVRVLSVDHGSEAVLYCSTSMWAFGPVFSEGDVHDAVERAEAFCRWLKTDARRLSDAELATKYSEWLAQEASQWVNEEAPMFEDAT